MECWEVTYKSWMRDPATWIVILNHGRKDWRVRTISFPYEWDADKFIEEQAFEDFNFKLISKKRICIELERGFDSGQHLGSTDAALFSVHRRR